MVNIRSGAGNARGQVLGGGLLVVSLLLFSAQVLNGQAPSTRDGGTSSKVRNTATTNGQANVDSQDNSTVTGAAYVRPTSSQRFHRYLNHLAGPMALAGSVVSAGIAQANNSPREWGQGADAFGKRFASSLGGNAARQTVNYGLSEAFKLDDKFYRSERKGFWPRASDALVQSVTSRTTTGNRVISAPKLAGYVAGGMVPLLWLPDRYGPMRGFRSAGFSLASTAGMNLIREFILKKK
jgi:hypothetical protein